jgi:Raf kinase inhibitor-like YbhB/YbcL family protein
VKLPSCEVFHKLHPILASVPAIAGLLMVGACSSPALAPTQGGAFPEGGEGGIAMRFQIMSDVFGAGDPIPSKFTCDGQDVSPPLTWSGSPQGARSLALIMEDPDAPAGIWVHWVLYNIPIGLNGLPEGVPAEAQLANGSSSGLNSWQRRGYGGPCPPSGVHRYFFRLYALDQSLDLAAGATKEDLLKVMQGHLLGQAEIMGTYTRSP